MIQKLHPDHKPDDEIFLGAMTDDAFNNVGWKTKRQGEAAEDDGPDLKPVFITRAEVEDAFIKTQHPGIRNYYTRMLATGDGQIKSFGDHPLQIVIEIKEAVRHLDDNRDLTGFELHAHIVPVNEGDDLHENTSLTWLMPIIVSTIRFILQSQFGNKVAEEFNLNLGQAPPATRPVEEIMERYQTATDVEFPAEIGEDIKPEVEPERVDFLIWHLPGDEPENDRP